MSRLGKQPVAIPTGVTITCTDGLLTVAGPKGTLTRVIKSDVTISIADGQLTLTPGTTPDAPALWGTYAAHVRNMIKGVTEGFTKVLDIEGVGYRAEVKGSVLVLNVGFSHPVPLDIPAGVTALVEKSAITLTAADKDLLGQFAANVRKVRKPEPYKGKGIRYRGEYIIRKQGKKAA
ncbi:MAG: 50S ribosomal protein L6 [Parcubacteria group bacterium GW2011_GWF2_44_8]|nr:MAG: 50S ribosomal protein L6 [Parcubacteria group bacterium GW2011_GWF2_44_8]